jgi:putative FmdB family regulatory protein
MPTYEYSCEKCGPFEIWQSIKDNALALCPTCGSKVQRLISANVGFVLKGAGFYQNDYKSQGAPKAETKDSQPPGPGCGTCGGPDPCPSGNN